MIVRIVSGTRYPYRTQLKVYAAVKVLHIAYMAVVMAAGAAAGIVY